jgi:hypothetical protein
MRTFFVRKQIEQLFSSYILAEKVVQKTCAYDVDEIDSWQDFRLRKPLVKFSGIVNIFREIW